MEKLEIKELSFGYGQNHVLENISMTLNRGDFVLLCGRSGCGKTTLLKHLKPSLSPVGERSGDVLLDGQSIFSLDQYSQASNIAFVLQDPDDQIVSDKVWHELAFGLESLGYENSIIRRKVAETASFFGMKDWYHKDVSELSGGQKQLLCLASAMTLEPELIVLDEPTSRLDPIAASEFISTLGRINRELGITVILSEHRPEDSFAFANKLAVMEDGRLIAFGDPKTVGKELYELKSPSFMAMPAAMRIYSGVGVGDCPLTIRDGQKWLDGYSSAHSIEAHAPEREPSHGDDILLFAKELSFKYSNALPHTLKGFDIELIRGEIYALLGSNGSGKTTALKVLAGLLKPLQGEITHKGHIAMLPQDPKLLLTHERVRDEINVSDRLISLCRLEGLLDRHPYTLSGGEQQRVALAKVLSSRPDILLLDEPTKGLDASFRITLSEILNEIKKVSAVLIVSHDTEFCAAYADRCGLLFDGMIVSEGVPREFFGRMNYFTTPTCRIAHSFSDAVTPNGLILACGGKPLTEIAEKRSKITQKLPEQKKHLPLWRKIIAGISSAAALFSFIMAIKYTDLSRPEQLEFGDLKFSIIFIGALALLAFSLGSPGSASDEPLKRQKTSKATLFALLCSFILIPPTIILGLKLPGRSYYITALLVLLECILPFLISFEKRRPSARELSRTAALCALGVAGRAAFFMLPQFKPVLAITILSGVNYGAESGFLVGAMTMLVSNILFSQGPWTPWQMFAMGLCGMLAGIIFRKRPNRYALCAFGGISAVAVYGVIMNLSSAVIWQSDINIQIILSYLVTGLPMDCVHAAATILFLWLLGGKKFN